MPVGIVDLLEVVDVDEQQRPPLPLPHTGKARTHVGLARLGIEDVGQAVELGPLHQLVLLLPLLVDHIDPSEGVGGLVAVVDRLQRDAQPVGHAVDALGVELVDAVLPRADHLEEGLPPLCLPLGFGAHGVIVTEEIGLAAALGGVGDKHRVVAVAVFKEVFVHQRVDAEMLFQLQSRLPAGPDTPPQGEQ